MPILWVVEQPQGSPFDLARTLQGEYPIRAFASLASFLKLVRFTATPKPDACLVVVPPQMTELRAIERRFHEFHPTAPCVFLAAHEAAYDCPVIHWPVEPLSQIQSVRALLVLPPQATLPSVVSYRELVLDSERNSLRLAQGHELHLTTKEVRLLRLFISHATKCLSRDAIKAAIWGKLAVSPRTIDVHVSRLRKHLADTGVAIENVYGGGYLLR